MEVLLHEVVIPYLRCWRVEMVFDVTHDMGMARFVLSSPVEVCLGGCIVLSIAGL